MPTWPSSLPTKVIAGTHNQQPAGNVADFQPDAGEPIMRNRYTGSSEQHSFELVLTELQKNTLLAFWRDDCAQGALKFHGALVDGVMRTWWFRRDEPLSVANIAGGTAYRVSLSLGCRA